MNTYADKTQENKTQAIANSLPAQRSIDKSPIDSAQPEPFQKKENNTGLPDNLKTGVENLSGFSMDDVKVHYNSDKPSQLQALAYAQGSDIHITPGQEKHLPHESWHVVQQKQGRAKPTIQMKAGVNINDDEGLEKEADAMGSKALQMRGTGQHNFFAGPESSVASIQLQPVAIPMTFGRFRDHRGGAYTLQALGNNQYTVIEDNITVEHTGADQYLMAGDDIFWDPLTGDAFRHLGGRNYRSMAGADFIYTQGYYHPVPVAVDGGLNAFLDQVWALRGEVAVQVGLRQKLNHIYNQVYSKSAQNTKAAPVHKSPTISALVNFSAGKNAHLQFGWPIPPDNVREYDIQKLYEMMTYEPYTQEVQVAAYNGLCRGYYYFLINGGVAPTARIILNVDPTGVPGALGTLWPIVSVSPLVQGMKAGGPVAAAQKLDSIIIYAQRGLGFDALLHAIQTAGIATVNLLPGLVAEQAAGIGVADEPGAVAGTAISFGQKRVILAYMALTRAGSQDDMRRLGATFFQQAGINTLSPANETGLGPNAGIQNELSQLLTIMNTR